MEPGTPVWYWARRKGESVHVKCGRILDINVKAGFARVVILNQVGIPVQTVEVKRLKTGPAPMRYAAG